MPRFLFFGNKASGSSLLRLQDRVFLKDLASAKKRQMAASFQIDDFRPANESGNGCPFVLATQE